MRKEKKVIEPGPVPEKKTPENFLKRVLRNKSKRKKKTVKPEKPIKPEPGPQPGPQPEPEPGPGPQPEPEPGPGKKTLFNDIKDFIEQQPEPGPEPGPQPEPGPEPGPQPEPGPGPQQRIEDIPDYMLEVGKIFDINIFTLKTVPDIINAIQDKIKIEVPEQDRDKLKGLSQLLTAKWLQQLSIEKLYLLCVVYMISKNTTINL